MRCFLLAELLLSVSLLTSQTPPLLAAPDGQPGVVLAEFIYDSASFPECHAATIAETPRGLVTAWFGGTEEGHNDVGIWLSRHVEGKWTPPVEVATGVQHADLRYPLWNPVLVQEPGGPLHLFYKCGPKPDSWWGMWTRSTDHGLTWEMPRRLPATLDGPVKNKPILLPGNILLCGSSTEDHGWRLHFEITPDFGKTWRRIGPINDGKEFSAIQPTFLQLAGGHIQILCRTRQKSIATSTSSDGGLTWSPLIPSILPNPSAGIDAVTLKDGRHLLVYNHTTRHEGTPRDREMLNVALSTDGAKWFAACTLEREPGEFSYPAVIQTQDGLVHTAYTWQRKKIRHVVLDPRTLKSVEITDAKWPLP